MIQIPAGDGYNGTTAIVRAEETGIESLVAAQAASGYLAKVSVLPGEISDYSTKLTLSKKTDRAECRKRNGILAVLFRRAKPKPSPRTKLLERILTANAEIQTSAAVFKDIPETIKKNHEKYEKLAAEEQDLLGKIESYRDGYARAEADTAVIALLPDYELLSEADRKKADEVVKAITGMELEMRDADTRDMLYGRLRDENRRLRERVEMDFPFAERELGSARRQMKVIEQYDEEKVKKGFLPAMDKLHELKCEYNEAMTRADVQGADADLEGISQRCGDHIAELRAMREEREAEEELEKEVAADVRKLDEDISPKAKEDLMSRMDRALGRDSVQYRAPSVEEPAIIEGEFIDANERKR